jgi:hypothetical protein
VHRPAVDEDDRFACAPIAVEQSGAVTCLNERRGENPFWHCPGVSARSHHGIGIGGKEGRSGSNGSCGLEEFTSIHDSLLDEKV